MVLMVLVAVILVSGCGANFTANVYKTMYIAGSGYDTGMKVVADLQKQGKITAEQRLEINGYANRFYAPYQVAAKTLSIYNKTQASADKNKLISAIGQFVAAWPLFADSINRFQPGLLEAKLPEVTS